ncbi:MAG: hypothetical protein R2812_00005 [Gelidibacter sp.]
MKKYPQIIIILFIFTSCNNVEFYKSNKFYQATEHNREFYLTFLNDTVAAMNSDSLKTCSWDFMNFKKSNNGLFATDEHKIDTLWFKIMGKELFFIQSKEKVKFRKSDFTSSETDSLLRQLKIIKGFSDKGITYDCEYSLKEIAYFYDAAIAKAKSNLKNPNSANFNKAKIHKQTIFDELKNNTTVVSLDIEAKNGFGNFTENTYYVFFKPNEDNVKTYSIEFSDSPFLAKDVLEEWRLKVEKMNE